MGGPPSWRLTNIHRRANSIARNVIYSDPHSINSDRRLVIFSLPFVFHSLFRGDILFLFLHESTVLTEGLHDLLSPFPYIIRLSL